MNNFFIRLILVTAIGMSIRAFGESNPDKERPVKYYNTDHSDHYTFSSKYSDLTALMRSRYEYIVYMNQLASIDATVTRDLHQILDIRTNPVNMKNKKWSNMELDNMINECLKKGDKK